MENNKNCSSRGRFYEGGKNVVVIVVGDESLFINFMLQKKSIEVQ